MVIDIDQCDLNHDYFHFTNQANVSSILNSGLLPSVGAASQLVNDEMNVSLSKGGKGIMGILNSFIHVFCTKVKISEIPEVYQKYFLEISDFTIDQCISKDVVCKAMIRKLQDEVYFRVELDDAQLERAKIGGLTGYDIKLPMAIDKSKLSLIVDRNHHVLSAYDVAYYVYEKAKDIDVFRVMNNDFFTMFEFTEKESTIDSDRDLAEKKR